MLEVKNLSYSYENGFKALKNISFDSSKGNINAFLGYNGSGKTTLFSCLMGILKKSEGSIKLDGKEISYRKKDLLEYRKKINLVFQDPEKQIFYSDVYDDCAFALRNLGYDEGEVEKRVKEALIKANAYEFLHLPVHFLSYGQKKRAAIASTLAIDGQYLLMDEPTAGLDPESSEIVKESIKEAAREKKVFISTHDMDLAYELADYIYLISHGEIIYSDEKKKIFKNDKILKEAGLKKPFICEIAEALNSEYFDGKKDAVEYIRSLYVSCKS